MNFVTLDIWHILIHYQVIQLNIWIAKYTTIFYGEIIPGAVLPSLFSLVRFLYVTVNKSVFLFPLSLYSFLWPTHSIFFLFVCLIVFQEDLCGHDRNIIETVDCQWEYNNSGDKYSMWLPKNHQFSLKENLRRIFSVVIDVFPFLCVRYDGETKEAQFYCK